MPLPTDPNVLVGFHTNDDAGVYLLDENSAIVQTVDFFTPIVDDPFTFGQVAATNSLSDVYAMGGRPVSALSLVGFPDKGDPKILEQIILGGLDKMAEANCAVIGGHSIRNEDILFGYSVTGAIHPKKIWRNVGARTNDVVFLTKSIGTGVLSTAIKHGRIDDDHLRSTVASMTQLNRSAAEALRALETECHSDCIHAVTDVTGFGLLGHAREMALGDSAHGVARVSVEISHRAVPLLPGALDALRSGMIPGGLNNNRDFIGDCVAFTPVVPEEIRAVLFDPQTSGGLLVALDPHAADQAPEVFNSRGVTASRIGRIVPKSSALISVI